MHLFTKKLLLYGTVMAITACPLLGIAKEPPANAAVPIYINQVLKPYTLIKKITTEVYVLDAGSEEEAELEAFNNLRVTAAAHGADGLMEVKRYIVKDNIASRPSNSTNGSILTDDIDATATVIDEQILDSYERGKGTLSTARIDQTFDRSKLSEKIIRFSGKAIKFD